MQIDSTLMTENSLRGAALMEGLSAEALQAIDSQCRWVELTPDDSEPEAVDNGETYFVL